MPRSEGCGDPRACGRIAWYRAGARAEGTKIGAGLVTEQCQCRLGDGAGGGASKAPALLLSTAFWEAPTLFIINTERTVENGL